MDIVELHYENYRSSVECFDSVQMNTSLKRTRLDPLEKNEEKIKNWVQWGSSTKTGTLVFCSDKSVNRTLCGCTIMSSGCLLCVWTVSLPYLHTKDGYHLSPPDYCLTCNVTTSDPWPLFEPASFTFTSTGSMSDSLIYLALYLILVALLFVFWGLCWGICFPSLSCLKCFHVMTETSHPTADLGSLSSKHKLQRAPKRCINCIFVT